MTTVKEAKAFIRAAGDAELLAEYRRLKAKQMRMPISRLIAACRVTDKLYGELQRRGIDPHAGN